MAKKQPESFGSLMTNVLERRGLSYAQVARTLGHKSKTTLYRILNDECTPATAKRFYHAFLESGLCEMESEEQRALEEALEICLLGQKQYRENQAMWSIFRKPDNDERDVELCVGGRASPAQTTLKALLEECFQADEAHLLVFNACQTPLFPLLANFLQENKNAKLHIDHLLLVDGDAARTAYSIRELMGILCDARLHSCSTYACECEPPPGQAVSMRDDWFVARLTFGSRVREWQALLSSTGGYMLSGESETGIFDFWRDVLRRHAPNAHPIRKARIIAPTESSFLAHMEHFAKLERDQSLYIAKGGVFINLVPPEILRAAYIGGTHAEAEIPNSALNAAAARLEELQTARYENRRRKYRSTYYICTHAEIANFVRTGFHPIKIPFFRPYTLEERQRILQSILDEMRDNPYFDFRILRNDAAQSPLQMCFLEDDGVFFVAPCPGADGAGKYVEAVILQREFNDQLRNFFRRELLGRHSLPPAETRDFLARTIQELGDTIASSEESIATDPLQQADAPGEQMAAQSFPQSHPMGSARAAKDGIA